MVNGDLVSTVHRYFDVIHLTKHRTQACSEVNSILNTTESVNQAQGGSLSCRYPHPGTVRRSEWQKLARPQTVLSSGLPYSFLYTIVSQERL